MSEPGVLSPSLSHVLSLYLFAVGVDDGDGLLNVDGGDDGYHYYCCCHHYHYPCGDCGGAAGCSDDVYLCLKSL
jgi:hypothetical protein